MKTLILIAQVLLLWCVWLKTVSTTPRLYKASDGKEYLIEKDLKYNWYQAWNECARRDLQLVAIDTETKNNIIIEMLKDVIGKSHNLWLGGSDEYNKIKDHDRPFYWTATGKQFTFAFWSVENPDNKGNREHCTHIWSNKPLYEWNDAECTNKMGFICETNHILATYTENMKINCNYMLNITSSITSEFDDIQKQKNSEINTRIENIDHVGDDLKLDLQDLLKTTQVNIEKMLNEEQTKMMLMTEKMLQRISDLNVKLKKSTAELNDEFGAKLVEKQNEINKTCL